MNFFAGEIALGTLSDLWNSLDFSAILSALMRLIAVFLCLTVHETCHGLAAYALGDPTAKREHRLSLNPLHHIDWLGLALMFTVGFGWAKPVPVNPNYFKKPKQGMAITALAGPVSNFVLALLLLLAAIPGDNAWNTVHNVLRGLMGWCCYLMGPLMMIVAVLLTMDRTAITPGLKSASVVLMVLLLCGITHIIGGSAAEGTFAESIKALYLSLIHI